MSCLIETLEIRKLAESIPGETVQSVLGLVALWQKRNNKSIDEYPSVEELTDFKSEIRSSVMNWARTAPNNYEISTKGDKRFSALNAKFRQGTIIDGVDVSGRTIEDVYQSVIKKSRKGQAPSKDSKLYRAPVSSYSGNITPDANTIFVFGSNPKGRHSAGAAKVAREKFGAIYGQGEGLQGNAYALPTKDLRVRENNSLRSIPEGQIIESIKKLYDAARQNSNKQFKIAYRNTTTASLNGYTGLEMIDMFLKAGSIPSNIVFSKEWVDTGKFNLSKEALEDFSYYVGYFPLWKEWARQNPELIEELRQKSAGKILTDQFANTRVSQARALAEILNSSLFNHGDLSVDRSYPFETTEISISEEQSRVDLDFTPTKRRDRVSLIARLFSNEINKALQETNSILNKRIERASSEEERNELRREINGLNRFDVIEKITPAGLFGRVFDIFQSYVSDSEDNRVQAELDKINSSKGADRFSDEDKLKAAQRRAEYKTQEYKKVLHNFNALAEETSSILRVTEGLLLNLNYTAASDVNLNEENPEGISVIDQQDDIFNKEETFKEGWMTDYRRVSNSESLTQAVRKAINNIPKLDYNGKREQDDLGFPRYLDPSYVVYTLLDKLSSMVTSKDMIPLLQELSQRRPWVKQVIKLLQKDETLFSQFYQNFRKNFTSYWIQKEKASGNDTIRQTININKSEGYNYLINSWRDNYDSGTELDSDSIYGSDRELNQENAKKGLEWTRALNNRFSNLDTSSRIDLMENDRIWNSIMKLLRMIGIDTNPALVKEALTNIKSSENVKYTDPIMLLFPQLDIIFSGVASGEVKTGDLINNFDSAYTSIASLIKDVGEDAFERSFRDGDKSYFSYTNPNYIGDLIKQLNDTDERRFKEFIDKEYKPYWWFFKNEEWRNDWLNQIINSRDIRKGLKHKVVISSEFLTPQGRTKLEYSSWDELEYTLILLTEYFSEPEDSRSNIKWAWYHLPILSDAASAEFIRFRKYESGIEYDEDGNELTYDDIILDKLVELVNQEYDRIMLVRQLDEEYQNGNHNVPFIANYNIARNRDGSIKSIGGAEFKFLPALNSFRYEDGKLFVDKLGELSRTGSGANVRSFIKDALREIMERGFEEEYNRWNSIGVLDGMSRVDSKYSSESRIREALRNYYWNSKLATSQIIQLATTDLAFYKDMKEFQKRFKEVHAPSLRLNTSSTYKGERTGRDFERTIYLKDDEVVSSVIQDIVEVIMEKHNKGELSDYDTASILSKYGYTNYSTKNNRGENIQYVKIGNSVVETSAVNVADAQAYRSLSSYRAILDMQGQWNDDMERAYNNLQSGTWNAEDFNIIWQTKKPFVYSQIGKETGINGYENIKVPVQHKNSEFLLLAVNKPIGGVLGKSDKLRAINEFMEENNIDVVQFESAVKVGKQGVIDLNSVHSFNETKEYLKNATIKNGIENPNVVHKISYEHYGIQTLTPEHSTDATQSVGTQIRKLIAADMPDDPNFRVIVDGKKLAKGEWWSLYNEVITENILDSYLKEAERFKLPSSVEKILHDNIRGDQRYGIDTLKSCTINKQGEFNIPLFEPLETQMIQNLLTSTLKQSITKQKTKGGSLIQASDYGITDKPKIVFEGTGKNKRIKYIECYMPAYSESFFSILGKKGTHELDINKLDTELRIAIGYRVPTENAYSMIPLYIKGFLPQQNGSAIILPDEITTIAGSDFDIDKVFIMLPEFDIIEYDYARAKKDFKAEQKVLETLAPLFKEGNILEDLANSPIEFKEWFNDNRENYRLPVPRIEKVRYDFNKAPKDNSLRARNNLLIDMMWGVLTHPDTASRILNPGSFDYQKRAARIVRILEMSSEKDLRSELGLKEGSIIDYLMSLDLSVLNKMASIFSNRLDPLAPSTQTYFHRQNMTGANLIGIYANHNANHALMQYTRLELNENGSFKLNGKTLTSLHSIMNDDKEYISKNNAGYLNASVDNAKDPVLADINQNMFTADATMLLSRLGYNPIEVGLLITQPIVKDMTQTFFKTRGSSKELIMSQVLDEYQNKAALLGDISYDYFKGNDFSIEDLANDIMMFKELDNMSSRSKINFYKRQTAVGYLFKRIMRDADYLSNLVQSTKFDTDRGGAGPTIAHTEILMQRASNFIESIDADERFPLNGAKIIVDNIPLDSSVEVLRDNILKSPLPFLQAFYTLGVKQSENLLGKYFPQFTPSFREVIDTLRSYTRTGVLDAKTMNNIYNDLIAYIMSKTPFFGDEATVSSREKRRWFVTQFPQHFKEVISKNEDIANLDFIKGLRVIRSDSSPVDVLVFRNAGRLNPSLKEKYTRDWESLLYMDNPEAQKLALDLIRYEYYRNGFAFGPSTFTHLAPMSVKLAIPDYIDTLRSLLINEDDYSDFVDQYVYNHLDNRALVPMIPTGTTVKFTTDKGRLKSTVEFTIGPDSNPSDRKVVKNFVRIGSLTAYDFRNFIAKMHDGKIVYYRLEESSNDTAVYKRIFPLGVKNNFIEYEYGKDVEEIESIFSKDTEKYSDITSEDDSTSLEDPSEGDSMESSNLRAEDQDLINKAFNEVYGTPLEGYTMEDDILSIQPNTEYRDANGDVICGAMNIK